MGRAAIVPSKQELRLLLEYGLIPKTERDLFKDHAAVLKDHFLMRGQGTAGSLSLKSK